MTFPRAVLFDLDDTLAESFCAPTMDMIERLERLLVHVPIAIITGRGFARTETDFLTIMQQGRVDLSRLFVFPNSSAQCYIYRNGSWQIEYGLSLTPDERTLITKTILETVDEIPDFRDVPFYGKRIDDREAQITYTVVGIDAPQETKITWDPDRSIRLLVAKLPDFEVVVGGASTIDITRKGINKAYGVQWLSQHLNIPPKEMLFIGDGLTLGGNDAPVIPTGIQTRSVTDPDETAEVIDGLLALSH